MTNAQWDFAETVVEGQPGIEFTYTISAAKLKKHLVRGPIKVTRTYWLPEIAEDDRYNLKARDSHVKTRIKIENLAGEPLDVAYELRGPTGTPTEGWWYVNKIHGRSSAVGYMLGHVMSLAVANTRTTSSLAVSYTHLTLPTIYSV